MRFVTCELGIFTGQKFIAQLYWQLLVNYCCQYKCWKTYTILINKDIINPTYSCDFESMIFVFSRIELIYPLYQYFHCTSVSPWRCKTAWITYIIHRATVICHETKIQAEICRIRERIAWNGFPKSPGRALIAKKLKNVNTANNKNQLIKKNNTNTNVMWINLPYLGTQSDQLLLSI